MDAQVETIEARLQSFLGQLQSEVGVLDRIVHKNKNQHRRSSYFNYLLKVRRDCKLLQSTNLEETVKSSFLVINGDRPNQKVQLLESLKRRKCDGGKHNFLVRLQGGAHLLSQLDTWRIGTKLLGLLRVYWFHVPEVGLWEFAGEICGGRVKELTSLDCLVYELFISLTLHREISTLLARSFFMGFSMTVLALLARLRVLTQQVIREYYPTNEQAVFLECVWETDNFILLEKKSEPETIKDDVICQVDNTPEEDSATMRMENLSSMEGLTSDCKQVDDQNDDSGVLEPSSKNQEHKETTSFKLFVYIRILPCDFRSLMEVSIDEDSSSSSRVQTLEAIKGGGGSIKVGTTGTINALMTRELQSIKVASPKTPRSPKPALDGAKDTKPKADEASTSSSSSTSNTMNEKHKTRHHHTRKGSRNPILNHSDSVTSVDGTRKNNKKGSCMVEIVDIKCGVPDKNWTNPITNKFKKLTFSKLSETNGVK
ncbi:hypothetical protein OSB04_007772 [Centaurea solstitialis]|uniref:Nucleolus and neural progenitor protein-like N-terminal domain-containing protein n=1 Tax=Centaurea solstitialis TaxID=347529 RepID=A0AA38WIT1_9ASTR|nr:hypothetical protein OSB04_007772 [Centaurea solstitialis]